MPDSLFVFRLLLLLATAVSSVFVYRIATHLIPRRAALIAPLLFYAAPLQFYGLLAMPQAMMQVCCIAGSYFICFFRRRALLMPGAVLLLASLLYKPLSLSAAIALGLSVVLLRQQRPKAVWMGVTGVVVGALCAEGRLRGRHAACAVREIANTIDVASAIEWNVNEHKRAFLGIFPLNGNIWLLALAVGGSCSCPARARRGGPARGC